ncbi:hypothetical protein [Sphingobacterium faecale]|uniref:Uncharacterized protein n=1 Tax=Sphingobacterium faecale TaxID=2803775 RepID=A0ABS1R9Z0_9SPHI|nr:hypothetical protein [Sphingobacterium faecale]MBL1411523.1 hypothetical protein [Sphingobacterium faecale]
MLSLILSSEITEKDLSGSAIWQVGLKDGIYLGILKEDGSVLDWDFVNRFCGNGD